MIIRIAAIGLVFGFAAIGWLVLGGSITGRTATQFANMKTQVGELWGMPLEQKPPSARLEVTREKRILKTDKSTGRDSLETETVTDTHQLPLVESDLNVRLELDQRRKGLLWYSTYRVAFQAAYAFHNNRDSGGETVVTFDFPAPNGPYDEFKFEIDGVAVPIQREQTGQVAARVRSPAGSRHAVWISYRSQGLDYFVYKFGDGISEIRNFKLSAETDFDGYDHPDNTISPTFRERTNEGWRLTWTYADLIAGGGIGVKMPHRPNPGPLAARISFFAPVSLGFFFFLMFIISSLRNISLHPMNYFFIAAGFFSFHLLLAYLVDHISIHVAFAICSAVSILLVVSYVRVVVGNRFAFLWTALSQFVYLVGFSYAFFFEGFTGLTVTIGAIITLFIVMQMTARIDWATRFQKQTQLP